MTEHDLDSLFAAARADAPRPPASLTARVLADAGAEMTAPAAPAMPHPAARPPFWADLWARLSGAIGGGGVMAGMVTATLAGFYIGFAEPVDTRLLSSVMGVAAEIDMMPGIDALLDEAP